MGFPPPGYPPRGGVVVHQARILPRLALVAVIMLVSTAVTGSIVWLTVLSGDDDIVRRRADAVGPGEPVGPDRSGATTPGVALPTGWPEALTPPGDATLVSSVAQSVGTDDEQLILVYDVPGEPAAAAEEIRRALAAAGLRLVHDAAGSGGGSLQGVGAGRDASISVGPASRPGVTTVSWVLRRGPR